MMAAAIRVLYVDDEPDLLGIGKLFLEESGDFTVTTALSAQEALRLLEQEKFDAIVSDYQMPDMDGIQFLVEVRTRFGLIPFILFTGRGREEIVIQAINSGADFYIQKGGEPGAQFAELSHKIKQAALRNRAENSLRKSEEKYRHLIEHSNEAILVAQDGMLKLVNHRLIELLGYSEQELLSTPFPVFIHPDDRAMVMERYQKRLKCEEFPSRYPFRLNPKDGNLLWVEISAVVIDWDGRPATLNFLTDITERKQADDSLREEQQFSKLLLDSLPGIFYLYTYPENRMVRWNKQHETLLGYTADEIKGKLGTDLHLPEYKDAVLKAIDEVMEKGQSSVESTLLAKDGRLIPFFFTGVRFETPGQLYFMGIGIEITERKKAEEALIRNTEDLHSAYEELTASEEELRQNVEDLSRSKRELSESEEKFRVIADYTVNWESWFGTDGKYIWVSPSVARFTGYTQVEILTMPDFISTVIAKEDRAMFTERFREAIQGTSGENFEFRYIHRNGTKHWLNVSWQPIVDINGNSFGTRASGHDITGRVQVEEALRSSEEKYRKAFFTSPNAICITRLHDGMFISINKGFTEITGYTEEDVIGKTSLEINIWKDPEDRRKIVEGLQAYGEVRNYEARFLTKTGEIYGSMSTSVIELNGVPHILNITSDITKRKLAEAVLLKKTEELHSAYEELTSSEEELRQNVDDLAKSEQALRESEERLGLALNVSQMGTWDLNLVNHTAWRSLRHDQIFGYESLLPEWTYEMFIGHVLPEDRAEVNRRFEEANSERHDWEFECRIRRTDGEIRWIWAKGRIQYGNQGDPERMLGLVHDITGRKQMEEALRESKDKFRQLFTRMPSAVAIYDGVDAGEDFIIKDFNAAAEKIEGIKKDDIIGKRVTQVFPGVKDFGIFAVFQRVWRTGQLEFFPSALYRDERDPGTWRENWVYKLASGEVIAIYHDITQRKRAEEALWQSEKKYRDIFEKSVSGLFKTSADGHLIDANDALAHMYGYSDATEMLKADLDIGTHLYANPDDRKEVLRILAEKGMVENYEILHSKRDGTRFWGIITARTIRNDEGTVLFFEGSNIDISERKVAEEALIQANKKLNLLSSITRHDINNQLTGLQGYLTLLEKKQPDPSFTEYFQKINAAAQRISTMIQFTKEYDKIGVNSPVWQNCRTLVDIAVKQAPLGKIVVKNDLPFGTEVFADPLVVKVCYNLMDNAARYGGKITTIRFAIEERDSDHIVVCEDDGEGVVAGEKDKIFERGFGKNTGLGLALSREILSITNITIRETGEPGKGARFEMMIPKGAWRNAGKGP